MPIYRVADIQTEDVEEHYCSWDSIQEYLKDNPNKKLLPAAPAIVSGVMGQKSLRVPDSFKDVLRNIKSKHRGSTIDV